MATSKDKQDEAERRARLVARGQRIRELRLRAGFKKQLHVVQRLGLLNSGTLSQVERGEQDLYCLTAEGLADAYGVTVDVLLGRSPIPASGNMYPRRACVLESEEFLNAPEELQQEFLESSPPDAHTWSPVRWADAWLGLLSSRGLRGSR